MLLSIKQQTLGFPDNKNSDTKAHSIINNMYVIVITNKDMQSLTAFSASSSSGFAVYNWSKISVKGNRIVEIAFPMARFGH